MIWKLLIAPKCSSFEREYEYPPNHWIARNIAVVGIVAVTLISTYRDAIQMTLRCVTPGIAIALQLELKQQNFRTMT